MSIHSVTIKTGSFTHSLTDPFVIKAGTRTRLPVSNRVVAVGVSSPGTFFDDAKDIVVNTYGYISSINNVGSKDDGQFWLHQDRCLSWTAGSGTQPGYLSGGLKLFDLCPACADCRSISELRQRVEDVHIMLNTLKDVNLYNDVGSGSVTYLATKRRQFLENSRGTASAACSTGYERLDMSYLKARQLLWNYATMVHMWNYVVTHLNTKTRITIAPEDDAGFVVQVMHAVPSCDGSTTVNAQVSVTPYTNSQQGLSMLVVGKTDFKPFKPAGDPGGDYENRLTVSQSASAPTSKTVATNFGPAEISGVYMLEAKFLPFRKVTMTDTDGSPIDFSDSDMFGDWSTGTTQDGGTSWATNTSVSVTETVIGAPTVEDYNEARTFPSKSVYGTNEWQIQVSWTSVQETTTITTETYIFRTNKVRDYEPRVLADEVFTEPPNSSDSGIDPGSEGDTSGADDSGWWSDSDFTA